MSIGDYSSVYVYGISSNSDSAAVKYVCNNQTGQLTYSDHTTVNNPVVGNTTPEIQAKEYFYAPYESLQTTVTINTNELIQMKFDLFDDSSPRGKIHKLSESIKKLKERL